MARARIVFRILIGFTLLVPAYSRLHGGRLPHVLYSPFSSWFLLSVLVFGAFGLASAWHAWHDPLNRRAYLTDVILAAAWIPYWSANLQRIPALFY